MLMDPDLDPAGSGSTTLLKLVDYVIKHTFAGTKAFLKSGLFVNFGQYSYF
jgi:hypothetical protein